MLKLNLHLFCMFGSRAKIGWVIQCHPTIRSFPLLVATGIFSPERGLPVNLCVDFNHFKCIIMSALLHSKTLKCSFMKNFTALSQKFNLLKSSLWICHWKMIKMYRKLDRKSPFTYAATLWSSTLENGELIHTTDTHTRGH